MARRDTFHTRRLVDLVDVDTAGIADDNILIYKTASNTFQFGANGGGGSGTVFLTVSEFDPNDGSNYYYGGVDDQGDWKINRFNKTTLIKTSADEVGNPSYTTLSAAWTDRTTLTYS